MKSLEIVNEFIKNIEDTLKEIKSGPFYDIKLLDLNKFKTIKQDLEVLEILEQIKTGPNFMGGNGRYKNSTQSSSLFLEDIAVIEKALDKLDKYEKAFEILKKSLFLANDTSLEGKKTFYYLYIDSTIPYENYRNISKEEYELLEEVLNDEKN